MEFGTITTADNTYSTIYTTTTGGSFAIDGSDLSNWASAAQDVIAHETVSTYPNATIDIADVYEELCDKANLTHTVDVGDLTEAEEDRIVDKLVERLRQIANDEKESDVAFKDYLKEVLGV